MSQTTLAANTATPPRTPVIAFNGAIHTLSVTHPSRLFAFHVTFRLQHPKLVSLRTHKPPLHFHPYQYEYIRVLSGRLGFEANGREYVLTSADGEVSIAPWAEHRLYPAPPVELGGGGGEGEGEVEVEVEDMVTFELSGADTEATNKLDELFFENWYAYQDEVYENGDGPLDMIQVMSMFDAGGSYATLPTWIPGSKYLARALGIVVGRWIGGLLGYQPYYKRWSTDWGLACERMRSSVFQRRFAVDDKTD